MPTVYSNLIQSIRPLIHPKDFEAPLTQSIDLYFPDFLNAALDKYVAFYKKDLLQHIDLQVPFDPPQNDNVISKIEKLSTAIIKTVELFYQGKIFEATNTFNSSLEEVLFDEIKALATIPATTNFYRARASGDKQFTKSDLFHIKFELRHIVSTNRYSVPGFPSLYLGDSTYLCWEEFNRYRLRDLSFSRLANMRELKIIQIQRIEDFLLELNTVHQNLQLTFLLRFLVTFPLTIACSIKVKFPNGNFKPEYIIPQLLLQYVSRNDSIDGIKFLSTKVGYSKLDGVSAYNYVFPVKTVDKRGFCNKLADLFHLTDPTSLELEEIMYNPITHPMSIGGGSSPDRRCIELVEGQKSYYATTSFGKLETNLIIRSLGKV